MIKIKNDLVPTLQNNPEKIFFKYGKAGVTALLHWY